MSEVSDKDGNIISTSIKMLNGVKAFGNSEVEQIVTINMPQLWSPDNPCLYLILSKLYDNKPGEQLDEIINPLGLRWYYFSASEGFFLNGKAPKIVRC